MYSCFAFELRRTIVRFDEKLTQQESLCAELLGFSVLFAKQVDHLVAEDGDAARLQTDDRRTGSNIGAQGGQSMLERGAGFIEHAEVIEWTATAQRRFRNCHLITGVLQHFHSGLSDFRIEIIAEGIRP